MAVATCPCCSTMCRAHTIVDLVARTVARLRPELPNIVGIRMLEMSPGSARCGADRRMRKFAAIVPARDRMRSAFSQWRRRVHISVTANVAPGTCVAAIACGLPRRRPCRCACDRGQADRPAQGAVCAPLAREPGEVLPVAAWPVPTDVRNANFNPPPDAAACATIDAAMSWRGLKTLIGLMSRHRRQGQGRWPPLQEKPAFPAGSYSVEDYAGRPGIHCCVRLEVKCPAPG